jgi:hypothetical protein
VLHLGRCPVVSLLSLEAVGCERAVVRGAAQSRWEPPGPLEPLCDAVVRARNAGGEAREP